MKTKIILISILLFLTFLSANSGPRRVLLEFSTGTWCGYCPCGDSIILHNILPQYPQTIVLAYHGGGGGDPFVGFNGNGIISLLSINAYPLAVFDRQSGPGLDYDYNWPETCAVRYQRTPNSMVSLVFTNKTYNSTTHELSATIDATALQNLTGQYKVTYEVAENNINYQQYFYSSCGTPGYHSNYIHYWVVRNIVNGATGENLNSGAWNQNQTITRTVTTTLNTGWVDVNCNLIIFVYKDTPPLYASTVEQTTIQSVTNPLGIEETGGIPSKFSLSQNYPNPFNPATNIHFSIPKDGNVSLKIYDMMGRVVQIYVDGFMRSGYYNAEVDGSNLSSGVYLYTLKANDFSETKKMVLVK